MKRTENYNLPQFEPTDTYKLEDYNEAYEVIDSKIKELDTKLAEAQSIIDTWTQFKNNGGDIGGKIGLGDGTAYIRKNGTDFCIGASNADRLVANYTELRPGTNNAMNFGSPSYKWKDIHTSGNIYANDTVIYRNSADSMLCNDVKGGSIGFQTFCNNGDVPLLVFTSGQKNDDSTFRPNTANNLMIGLGSAQARWRVLYFGDYYRDLNGYTDLPNGMKMVWGNFDVELGAGEHKFQAVTFPIAFKSQIFFCCANVRYNITEGTSGWIDNMIVNFGATSLSSASIAVKQTSANATKMKYKVCWMAFGV